MSGVDEVNSRRERIVASVSDVYKDVSVCVSVYVAPRVLTPSAPPAFPHQNLRAIKAEVLSLIRSGSSLRPTLVDIGACARGCGV